METNDLAVGNGYRLTDAQVMLLWEEAFSDRRKSAPPVNILGFYLKVPHGDLTALSRAFNKVLETNDSLRLTLFRLDRNARRETRSDYSYITLYFYRRWLRGLRQSINDFTSQEFPVIHLADQKAFQDYIEMFRKKHMPLLGERLYEAELVTIGQDNIALLTRFHHVTIDGFSFKLLFERLVEYYGEYKKDLEPKPDIYSVTRYFLQDEEYRKSPRLGKDFAFWKKQFTTQPHYSFPCGRTPLSSTYKTAERYLTGEQYRACCELSSRIGVGCSNYSLLMFLGALTVYRITGKTNFALFHMSHGRYDTTGRQTIGSMINMIPVFFNLDIEQSFEKTIVACRTAYVESMMHSHLSFNELIKLYIRETVRHGFNFNHAWMVFSSLDLEAAVARTSYDAGTIGAKNQPHQFFACIMEIPGEQINLYLRYQTKKYSRSQAESYIDTYLDTFDRLISMPDAPLSSLRNR